MKTALLVIATGQKYHKYIEPLLESAKKYFVEHDPIVWTDSIEVVPGAHTVIQKEAEGFPDETLHRYHTFAGDDWLLRHYDQLFYCDVDMRFVSTVGEEIFSSGITATLHPGYVGTVGTPERRPDSMAGIPFDANNRYFCGGFNGGDARAFLDMSAELAWRIDKDQVRGITAIWHDESHLNRYLFERPPAKILSPAYCYPDVTTNYYVDKWIQSGLPVIYPKLLALEKPR